MKTVDMERTSWPLFAMVCYCRVLLSMNKQPMGYEAQLATHLYKHFYDDR